MQVRDVAAPGDVALFYSCFRHLAARPDAELRRACAAQLPALMAAPLQGATHAYFHDTFADMAADHDEQVGGWLHGGLHGGCMQQWNAWGLHAAWHAWGLIACSCWRLSRLSPHIQTRAISTHACNHCPLRQVRTLAAGAMAQLASLMPPTEAGRLLRRPLVAALSDEAVRVRDAALAALAPLMGALAGMEEPHREALGGDLHAALARVQVRL